MRPILLTKLAAFRRLVLAALFLSVPLFSRGATVVDWLTFTAGADRTQFSLSNDAGQTLADGQIDLTTGALAPLSPGAGALQAVFWVTTPSFQDSLQSDSSIPTTKVQVAPSAGAVQFQLGIRAQDLSGMVFVVGQLFGSGTLGTRELDIGARTSESVTVPLEFLGVTSWDNGVRSYTQPLDWDGTKLSLGAQADGESAFAFFRLPPGSIPITEILLKVPNGYAGGSGDALEFAFGFPVPEPGVVPMLLFAFAGMLLPRCRIQR